MTSRIIVAAIVVISAITFSSPSSAQIQSQKGKKVWSLSTCEQNARNNGARDPYAVCTAKAQQIRAQGRRQVGP